MPFDRGEIPGVLGDLAGAALFDITLQRCDNVSWPSIHHGVPDATFSYTASLRIPEAQAAVAQENTSEEN